MAKLLALFVVVTSAVTFAKMPIPELPKVSIDTTFNQPTGTTWYAHNSADFKNALTSSSPGDVIVLDAGATYIGNFTLPVKSKPKKQWIYIESSALSSLPPPGTRVNPATDAVNMPKIVTPNTTSAITVPPGASYYRLVGLELTSASTHGCNGTAVPPINCWSYNLVYVGGIAGETLPDSITIDRSYLHGSPTQDVRQGVIANGTNVAIIDSYVSDVLQSVYDSQAVLAYLTPGPIKIVNNYLSSTTENIMLGGGGGPNNPYVPSDVEIRNNWLYKPLSWATPGVTLPPNPQWVVKNHLELKSAQRVLFDRNTLENLWAGGGQLGDSLTLTIRTSQSGNIAVVDDITITNNIIKNVAGGFSTLSSDYACGKPPYTQCTNPGEEKRLMLQNNLIIFRDPSQPGGVRNVGGFVAAGMTDFVLENNTTVAAQTPCFASIYFILPPNTKWPPPTSDTHNVWIWNNVLCRQVSGDDGAQGTNGLNGYMGDPSPVDPRFLGNVMFVESTDKVQQFPAQNDSTPVPFTYVDPTKGNYQLLTPDWTETSNGQIAGIDNSNLLQQ